MIPMAKIKIGIVVSKFNQSITSKMEAAARKQAESRGAKVVQVLHPPGCCDLPYVAQQLLKSKRADAIVVLGVLLHGETKHDEVVAHSAFHALQQLSLAYDKPIGFGIIGPGATRQMSEARAEEYAQRATDAAIDLADTGGKQAPAREHK